MAEGGVVIDAVVFWERLAKLHKAWGGARDPESLWKGADALVVDSGANNEDDLYSKSASLQTWLLGYEFPETIIAICFRAVVVLTSKKKVSHLEPLKKAENATLPLELLIREKSDGNAANYQSLINALKSSHSGGIVATLGKEKPQGEFAEVWRRELEGSGLTQVELAPALADLLAPKDATEAQYIKRAGLFTSKLISKHFVPQIEDIVDKERKVTHEKLALDAEDIFQDPTKIQLKLQAEHLEPCYTPIIQSGGDFDLKPSASSNTKNLYYSTVTCSMGARYKSYCANIGRTFFVNASKGQEKAYKLLMEMQSEAISALRPGVPLSAAYNAALNRLKSKAPQFVSKLTKNVGTITGIEFREGSLQLNAKNETRVRVGMTFNVAVGLEGLEDKEATDKRGKTYAVFLADTVVVKEEGPPEVYTDQASKAWTDISYEIKAEGHDMDEDEVGSSRRKGDVEILDTRTRGAGKGVSAAQETNEQLASHQSELEENLRLEALSRIKQGSGGGAGPSGPVDTPIAYREPNQMPNTASSGSTPRTNLTVVDGKAETVLIPMFGRLVPFHIATIKNVSKSEESGWTFLRINFVSPGVTVAQQQGMPKEARPEDHYIREMTLKARVPTNLNNTFRLIKELRKRVNAREKQRDLEADLVTQETLSLIRTGKVHRLRDVNVRPNVGGKKSAGTLELHANGLRFVTGRGEKLDLIFKNIKLAFYQPAQKEILVLIHFHLHDPIMIGKKKTRDVQFYYEIMESSYSLDATRRNGYDPDELQEEQEERRLKNKMNQEFQNFYRKIEEQAGDIEFDIPYRELGFYGVPPHNKSTCFIMPAVNALVELTEPPWFCIPLNDIEVASFERVVYGLKNFDLTLVLKDFTQKPVSVSAINVEHLDALKTWLDNCNIKFYEGTANLNWGQIMKHILGMGLEEFYEEGGWKNVLGMEDSEGEGEEEESEESDFAPSDDDEEEEEEDSDEYEEECSDEESEGEEELDSDESEGKDFDELEEEAKAADKSKGKYDEDEKPKSKGKKGRSGDYSASDSDDSKPAKKKAKGAPPPKAKGAVPSKSSSSKGTSSKGSSSAGKFFGGRK